MDGIADKCLETIDVYVGKVFCSQIKGRVDLFFGSRGRLCGLNLGQGNFWGHKCWKKKFGVEGRLNKIGLTDLDEESFI